MLFISVCSSFVFVWVLLLYSIIASRSFITKRVNISCFMVEIMRRYDSVVFEGMLKCYNNVVFFKWLCSIIGINSIALSSFILVRST